MSGIIDKIRESQTLEAYIEERSGFKFKTIGSWKNLPECPFCGGHECARLSPTGHYFCFQCQSYAGDIIQFRCLYEKILYKESVEAFAKDLGIKRYSKQDVDWIAIKEDYCEYTRESLFMNKTMYQWRGERLTPLDYLLEYRKHSYEAILHFRIGFNDGNIIDKLSKKYDIESIKASGLMAIPEGCFVYPFMLNGNISYFRTKDPNKIKKRQMVLDDREGKPIWFNQDVIKDGAEIFLCEGEDDVVSLWDCGADAVGCLGNLQVKQVELLKAFKLSTVYCCFDNDAIGQRDTDLAVKLYKDINTFIVKIPNDRKDIDEAVREFEDKKELINQIKANSEIPSPEMRSLIKQKSDGYYISKSTTNGIIDNQLTNWLGTVEAIIIQEDDIRVRRVKIKHGTYENTVFMDGTVLSNSNKFREFLLNNCNETCLFQGSDNDLNSLVQYWGVAYKPQIVRETDCVGDIQEGFIADNVFVSRTNEVKPLVGGYLTLNEKDSLKIAELTNQAGARSEIPYYPLTEPMGGIDKYKRNVFDTLVKNRNLKVGVSIGWMKAVLWSKMFFDLYKWFPLLMIHGKKEAGKTVFASWLTSMIGLRDVSPVSLRESGTTGVGLERRLAYYSCLPVFADDYRNKEGEGAKFHTFFRNVFNRISSSKGIKNDVNKIRQVIVRGCLLIDGESATSDSALNSRLVTFEVTQQERNDKYYDEILKMEPHFACIGFDWVKHRESGFTDFLEKYKRIEKRFKQDITSPRQASVWAVAVAGALTEPYFAEMEDKLYGFAVKLANYEIEQQRTEEIIGVLWEATDMLYKSGKLDQQVIYHNKTENQIEIHLPMLLGKISGESVTRKYELPSSREVAKILKQEPYSLGGGNSRVDGKVAFRWVFDLNHEKAPSVLKNAFEKEGGDGDKVRNADQGQNVDDL